MDKYKDERNIIWYVGPIFYYKYNIIRHYNVVQSAEMQYMSNVKCWNRQQDVWCWWLRCSHLSVIWKHSYCSNPSVYHSSGPRSELDYLGHYKKTLIDWLIDWLPVLTFGNCILLYARFFTFFFKIQKTWLFTFFELLHTFSRTLVYVRPSVRLSVPCLLSRCVAYSLTFLQILPTAAFLSSSGLIACISQTVYFTSVLLSISVVTFFSFFSVLHFLVAVDYADSDSCRLSSAR